MDQLEPCYVRLGLPIPKGTKKIKLEKQYSQKRWMYMPIHEKLEAIINFEIAYEKYEAMIDDIVLTIG